MATGETTAVGREDEETMGMRATLIHPNMQDMVNDTMKVISDVHSDAYTSECVRRTHCSFIDRGSIAAKVLDAVDSAS